MDMIGCDGFMDLWVELGMDLEHIMVPIVIMPSEMDVAPPEGIYTNTQCTTQSQTATTPRSLLGRC